MPDSNGPLSGVKVVACSTAQAGTVPYMLMADLGAEVNKKLVYVSISGYGPKGPHAALPGTDSMAQALGGIAEAYSTPGQPMKIGVVSVADETCAILALGGMLAALHCARTHGIGQKVECSLLGGQIR